MTRANKNGLKFSFPNPWGEGRIKTYDRETGAPDQNEGKGQYESYFRSNVLLERELLSALNSREVEGKYHEPECRLRSSLHSPQRVEGKPHFFVQEPTETEVVRSKKEGDESPAVQQFGSSRH